MAHEPKDPPDADVQTLDDDIMRGGAPAIRPPAVPAVPPPGDLVVPPPLLRKRRAPEKPAPAEAPRDIEPPDDDPIVEEPTAAADEPEEGHEAAAELPKEHQDAGAPIASTFKVALLGGKEAGKSYLFQAMVYRTRGKDAGALSVYLGKGQTRIYRRRHVENPTDSQSEAFLPHSRDRLVRNYEKWVRLGTTTKVLQAWYRLHLPYAMGWLGRQRSEMQLSFFDGSGDYLRSEAALRDRALWKEAFVDASVLILCLPMWAVFPDTSKLDETGWFPEKDPARPVWEEREEKLTDFYGIVHNYEESRRLESAEHKVQVIVALTQADSLLCEPSCRAAWIVPYIRNPRRYLQQLRTGRGVARYLADARAMSRYLSDLCDKSDEKPVSDLLNLDYGRGTPWFVPVTAVEGEHLDRLDPKHKSHASGASSEMKMTARVRSQPPVPAHVELPLLIALCEQHNALA